MDPRSVSAEAPAGELPPPPRQRWRLLLARSADAPAIAGRDLADAWEQAIEATGLPLHRGLGRPRPRIALGAQLPAGMAAEGELADVVLREVLPVWSVRESLVDRLPAGWRLIDLYDVWLGSPALAGQVCGAVYRMTVEVDATPEALAATCSALLAAARLPRTRIRGGSEVGYDLRPLLADIAIVTPGPPIVMRIQTRIHPELGSGRPEEVLAALGDRLGVPVTAGPMVRERLLQAGEPGGTTCD